MSDEISAILETTLKLIDAAMKEINAATKLRSKECNQQQAPRPTKPPKLPTRRVAATKLERGPFPDQRWFDFMRRLT